MLYMWERSCCCKLFYYIYYLYSYKRQIRTLIYISNKIIIYGIIFIICIVLILSQKHSLVDWSMKLNNVLIVAKIKKSILVGYHLIQSLKMLMEKKFKKLKIWLLVSIMMLLKKYKCCS